MTSEMDEAIAQFGRAVVAKLTESGAKAALVIYSYDKTDDPAEPGNGEVIEIISAGATGDLQQALILDLIDAQQPGGGYVRAAIPKAHHTFKPQ